MNYIVDTYAWVDYFIGSKKGSIVREIIDDDKNLLITPSTCITELHSWALRGNHKFNKLLEAVHANSEIEDVSLQEWISAAKIRHEIKKKINNFGLMDAVLIAKMEKHSAKILTGDRHFKGIKNVEYIGR